MPTQAPKTLFYAKKMAFFGHFWAKKGFFGDGGSETLDNLDQNLAKHFCMSPTPSKKGGGPYIQPLRHHKHCFRPKTGIFWPFFGLKLQFFSCWRLGNTS